MCVYDICVSVGMAQVCRSEDKFWELIPELRLSGLQGKCFYSLSHFIGSKNSHNSDNLLDHLVGQTGAEIMTMSRPYLDQTA